MKVEHVCQECGETFMIERYESRKGNRRFCSQVCSGASQRRGEWRNCAICNKKFYAKLSQIRLGRATFCCRSCATLARGWVKENNPNWKGGRYKQSDGYIAILVSGGRHELEHRVVMEKAIGRKLESHESVHHKNGDKADNRLDNLMIMTVSSHMRHHRLNLDRGQIQRRRDKGLGQRDKWVELTCLTCGRTYERLKSYAKLHPNTFCCRECYRQGAHLVRVNRHRKNNCM